MRARHALARALLVTTTIVVLWTEAPVGQAGLQGQWRTLTPLVPINPVHMALMHTGKVLIVSGSGNVASETNFRAVVWDPQTTGFSSVPSPGWDMFCNAMVLLPDGRPFINGGNLKYDPFWGEPRNAVFDPVSGLFTNLENMAHGRWYPTATVLGDGRVMSFSGLNETSATNKAVEIYTVGTGWSQEYVASWTPPLYPRMHLLPNGNVVYTGSGTGTRIFNTTNNTWSGVIATTRYSGTRTYGTSVLLPLTPANGYKPRVIIFGGGNPATTTTEIIDLSAPTPQWQFGPSMSQPRIEMNATILPNGKVLATGGSTNDEDAATASKNADLYDPSTNTFSSAGANVYPRLYHSNSLLLPDATVLLAGGNPTRGSYEQHLEIYSPAYLFKSDGTPATRPTITDPVPASVGYGATFDVQTPDAANITSVVFVRPGAATHAFDMEQRLVGLSYTTGSGVLTVTAPPNSNIAPPGYYMLFILNSAGVPSVASFVQLSPSPDFSISASPPSQTVLPGGSASYTVTATPTNGFSGTINFAVTGLPAGATASFNPASVVSSGPSTLTITTSASTPTGSYPLTITGTSGTLTRTSQVTLSVSSSVSSGLVLALSFDEGSGTVAADSSGNANHGTISGATWTVGGKYGNALVFNGTNARVIINDSQLLHLTTEMTLEAWVNPSTVTSTWRDVVYKGNDNYFLEAMSPNASPAAGGIFGSTPRETYGTAALTANTWAHQAATYDGATLRVYVNGVAVASVAQTGNIATSTNPLEIGGDSIYGQFFNGTIDEVRVYSRALTAAEIQTDMTIRIGGDTAPPVRSNGQPTGTLSAGTTQTTLSLTTNENATCRWATTAGVAYASMPNTFTTTGGTSHSTPVSGLTNGTSYTYYVRCQDPASNANPDDFSIAFAVASPGDTTPPVRSNGQPTGTLPAGTTQTTLSLTTNENATCRWTTAAGVAYASMPNTFTTTGGTSQSTPVSGLSNGTSYTYYVRCQDPAGNANPDDFPISFSVANPPASDTTPPTITITGPADGATISGNVTVSANANDNVGVIGVQFLVNGAAQGAEDTTAPYWIKWNTRQVANGTYQISARARDAANNQTTATVITVIVNNR